MASRLQQTVLKRRRLMLSFSSHDKDVADQLYEYLRGRTDHSGQLKYDLIKYDITFASVDFMKAMIEAVEKAEILVVLISAASIESRWVQFELGIAFDRLLRSQSENKLSNTKHDTRSRVIPVLISPVTELPAHMQFISHLRFVDLTSPTDGTRAFEQIVELVDNELGTLTPHDQQFFRFNREFNLATNYSRMMDQMKSALEVVLDEPMKHIGTRIDQLAKAAAATSSILSPAHVSLMEKDAKNEIWVISYDLYNDLYNEEFFPSIKENFQKGIKYVFFLENDAMYNELISAYEKRYAKLNYDEKAEGEGFDNRSNYSFVPLEPGTVMPFDEVVIYDPRNGRLASGYVQLTFDQHPTPQTVYIDLPKSTIEEVVRKLERIRLTRPASVDSLKPASAAALRANKTHLKPRSRRGK